MPNPFYAFGAALASPVGQAHKLFGQWNHATFKVTLPGLVECARVLNAVVFGDAFDVADDLQAPQPGSAKVGKPAVFVKLGVPQSNVVGLCQSFEARNYADVYVKSTLSPRNSLNTLAHEMVHAYVRLVSKSKEPTAHGVDFFAWAPVLRRFGILLTERNCPETQSRVLVEPTYLVYEESRGYACAWGRTRNAVLASTWAGCLARHYGRGMVSIVTKVEEAVPRLTQHPTSRSFGRHPVPVVNAGAVPRAVPPRLFVYGAKTPQGIEPLYTCNMAHWMRHYKGLVVDSAYSVVEKDFEAVRGARLLPPAFLSSPDTIDLTAPSWGGAL